MSELKPCPFCGAMPQCGTDFYESHGAEVRLVAVVQCTGCGVQKCVVFKASDTIQHIPFYDFDNAFDRVIKAWNMRAGEQDD
jgi:hypothetical protein